MLVTVAPTQPMSKSRRATNSPEAQETQMYVDKAHDVLDNDMKAICTQYSSLVSIWLLNEMTANQMSLEEAATALARNFLLMNNIKDLRRVGEEFVKTEKETDA